MCFRAGTTGSAYLSNSDDTDISKPVVCLELLDVDQAVVHLKQAASVAKWLGGLVPPIIP